MLLDSKFYITLAIAIILYFINMASYGAINDPTKPIYSNKSSVEITNGPVVHERKEMILQSIFISENKKIAVVNGEIYTENHRENNIIVKKINASSVVVAYKDKEILLKLAKKIYLDKVTGEISE